MFQNRETVSGKCPYCGTLVPGNADGLAHGSSSGIRPDNDVSANHFTGHVCPYCDKAAAGSPITAVKGGPAGKIPVLLSWSGGKDAAYSLYQLQQEGAYEVHYLFTVFDKDRMASMHGIPESLIEAQALSAGIPLLKLYISDTGSESYETGMLRVLEQAKAAGIATVAFGDIFLADLRQYRENQLQLAGMKGLFPLWQIDSRAYLRHFFQSGFEAVICCVNGSILDTGYCGKQLSPALTASFPAAADPCGENGEYHSFCYAGPVFSQPVPYRTGGFFNRFFPSPDNRQAEVCFRHLRFSDT